MIKSNEVYTFCITRSQVADLAIALAKLSLNLLIQFYLNNVSKSSPVNFEQYDIMPHNVDRDHRILWRHYTLCINIAVLSFDCVLPRRGSNQESATDCWTESGTVRRRAVVPCSWMRHNRRCGRTHGNNRWSWCCPSESRWRWSQRRTPVSWLSGERCRNERSSVRDTEVAQARTDATKRERCKLSHPALSCFCCFCSLSDTRIALVSSTVRVYSVQASTLPGIIVLLWQRFVFYLFWHLTVSIAYKTSPVGERRGGRSC